MIDSVCSCIVCMCTPKLMYAVIDIAVIAAMFNTTHNIWGNTYTVLHTLHTR